MEYTRHLIITSILIHGSEPSLASLMLDLRSSVVGAIAVKALQVCSTSTTVLAMPIRAVRSVWFLCLSTLPVTLFPFLSRILEHTTQNNPGKNIKVQSKYVSV